MATHPVICLLKTSGAGSGNSNRASHKCHQLQSTPTDTELFANSILDLVVNSGLISEACIIMGCPATTWLRTHAWVAFSDFPSIISATCWGEHSQRQWRFCARPLSSVLQLCTYRSEAKTNGGAVQVSATRQRGLLRTRNWNCSCCLPRSSLPRIQGVGLIGSCRKN